MFNSLGAIECLSWGHTCKILSEFCTEVGCGVQDWVSSYLPANTGSGCGCGCTLVREGTNGQSLTKFSGTMNSEVAIDFMHLLEYVCPA